MVDLRFIGDVHCKVDRYLPLAREAQHSIQLGDVTTPSPKGDGFSGYARPNFGPRWRLTDVDGGLPLAVAMMKANERVGEQIKEEDPARADAILEAAHALAAKCHAVLESGEDLSRRMDEGKGLEEAMCEAVFAIEIAA